MNSDRMKRAMRDAFSALKSMDPTELHNQIMERVGGPVAEMLIGSGMFEGRLEAARALLPSTYFEERAVVESSRPAVNFYLDLGTIAGAIFSPPSIDFTHVVSIDLNPWNTWTTAAILSAPAAPLIGHNWMYYTWEIRGSGEEAAAQEEMEWAKAA